MRTLLVAFLGNLVNNHVNLVSNSMFDLSLTGENVRNKRLTGESSLNHLYCAQKQRPVPLFTILKTSSGEKDIFFTTFESTFEEHAHI